VTTTATTAGVTHLLAAGLRGRRRERVLVGVQVVCPERAHRPYPAAPLGYLRSWVRFNRASTALQSVRHSWRSAGGNWSSALGSRSPPRRGWACKCVKFLCTRARAAAEAPRMRLPPAPSSPASH